MATEPTAEQVNLIAPLQTMSVQEWGIAVDELTAEHPGQDHNVWKIAAEVNAQRYHCARLLFNKQLRPDIDGEEPAVANDDDSSLRDELDKADNEIERLRSQIQEMRQESADRLIRIRELNDENAQLHDQAPKVDANAVTAAVGEALAELEQLSTMAAKEYMAAVASASTNIIQRLEGVTQ